MKRKRFTDEQIAFSLRQAESGTPVKEVCRKMGISEQTFYRWKKKYAGLGVAELRRLKQLEEENRKLKQLVADLSLDKSMLQDVLRGKTLTPDRRRVLAKQTQAAYDVSERRVCRVFEFARSSHRYESVADDQAYLRRRIREIAESRVSWGYPRVWVQLRRDGWLVNRKRGLPTVS